MKLIEQDRIMRDITEKLIFRIVSKKTGISENSIKGKTKISPVKIARQLVHFYVFENTRHATRTGNLTYNNHATVFNSKKRVLEWGHYPDYGVSINKIEPLLKKFKLKYERN